MTSSPLPSSHLITFHHPSSHELTRSGCIATTDALLQLRSQPEDRLRPSPHDSRTPPAEPRRSQQRFLRSHHGQASPLSQEQIGTCHDVIMWLVVIRCQRDSIEGFGLFVLRMINNTKLEQREQGEISRNLPSTTLNVTVIDLLGVSPSGLHSRLARIYLIQMKLDEARIMEGFNIDDQGVFNLQQLWQKARYWGKTQDHNLLRGVSM